MKITDVTAYPVHIPLAPRESGGIAPYENAFADHALEGVDRVIVRVDTDIGLVGWSEMGLKFSPERTVSLLEEEVGPMVIGRSPYEYETIRREYTVGFGREITLFSTIEMACWDLMGKEIGRPVFELLGAAEGTPIKHSSGDRERGVPIAYALGIVPPEEAATKATEIAEAGYSVIKNKAGLDWRDDVKRVIAMHEAVDGALEFRVDPNQGWTFDETVRASAMLADAGVYLEYLEQPITVNAHGTLATLRERTQQPIAPNEDLYIENNLRSLVTHEAMDTGVIDLSPAGGISGLRQLAGMAEDAGVSLAHHCNFDIGVRTAGIIHSTYAMPGMTHPPDSVYFALEDDVLVEPLTIEDGEIIVPDGPGLGIDVDESKLEEYDSTT